MHMVPVAPGEEADVEEITEQYLHIHFNNPPTPVPQTAAEWDQLIARYPEGSRRRAFYVAAKRVTLARAEDALNAAQAFAPVRE